MTMPQVCAGRLSLPAYILNKVTLSLLAVVIIIAGSVPFLNMKALYVNSLGGTVDEKFDPKYAKEFSEEGF